MIRLIRFLITGDWHLHEWETDTVRRRTIDGDFAGFNYRCRCKHCGAWKMFNL